MLLILAVLLCLAQLGLLQARAGADTPFRLRHELTAVEWESLKLGGNMVQAAGGPIELIPGDIVVGRLKWSPVLSFDPDNTWTHSAVYVGDGYFIEASDPGDDVVRRHRSHYNYPSMSWISYLRVGTANDEVRRKAVSFVLEMEGGPYEIPLLSTKQVYGESWYCSELPWAAYMYASGGAINLEEGPDPGWITVNEIYDDDDVVLLGGHYEYKPFTIQSFAKLIFNWTLLATAALLGMLSVLGCVRLRSWEGWELPWRRIS
jgi:hypothetical protein